MIPAIAWRGFGLNAIVAFWSAYVVTRPLGASVADYVSKSKSLSGLGFGDGRTALIAAVAVALGVAYLAITRSDIQDPAGTVSSGRGTRAGDTGQQQGQVMHPR
jgi:uncharacterized membrane-anchored protein